MKHTLTFSNLDKILFPQSNITKGAVITYYQKVAPFFLPLSYNRCIVMHRFPDGIIQEGFYQKQISEHFPKWLHRKRVQLKKGESQTVALVNTETDLLYLVNQAVLVFHTWLSQADTVRHPDKVVFDLDPARHDVSALRFVAKQLKKILEAHGLIPFIMTTGSRGYHIVVPIIPEHTFEKVHAFAKQVAYQMAQRCPNLCTIEVNKSKRKNRIFIDYLRNSFGQTSVAPYSLRALEGAPIATPLSWKELAKTEPQHYTIKNIFRRLARKKNPWQDFKHSTQKLCV